MSEKTIIQMKKYAVNAIHFNMNESFQLKPERQIRINPNFQRAIIKIDENNALVKLSINILETNEPLPFTFSATISGVFELEQWSSSQALANIMEDTALTVLFPYLRALVSTVTANSNLPPYFIPVLNIAELFKKQIQPISTTLQ
ncbi:MAG: protein-export chaperone SecB [Clostridia bacterium]